MMLQRLVVPTRSQAYRQAALLVVGTGIGYGTTSPSSTALCEDKKGILDTLLSKNKDGQIDWSKSVTQFAQTPFWDDIAKTAGHQVRGPCAPNMSSIPNEFVLYRTMSYLARR
jgi:hypothetical protein